MFYTTSLVKKPFSVFLSSPLLYTERLSSQKYQSLSFLPFSKMDVDLSAVIGIFAWLMWLFKYDGERFSNYISQSHQSSAFLVWLLHMTIEVLHSMISLKNCQFAHFLCPWGQLPVRKFLKEMKVLKFSVLILLFLFTCPSRTWSPGHDHCSPGCLWSSHLLLVHLCRATTGLVTLLLFSDYHMGYKVILDALKKS